MACMKLGSKSDAFIRHGQAWFCKTGLQSDVVVQIGKMSFHLHKFPLISRSGTLARLISSASEEGGDGCSVSLSDIPGGSKAFELIAKFCYGIRMELTVSNVVLLHCASHHLEMTEEYGESNLVKLTETFLNQVVFRSWRDSLEAIRACNDLFPYADELNVIDQCIDSLVLNSSASSGLSAWPMMQTPNRSTLWNGISMMSGPDSRSDWWFEDASTLSFPLFKRLILVMETHGIKKDLVAQSIAFYAKKYLSGLNRHLGPNEVGAHLSSRLPQPSPTVEEQRVLLEEIDRLIPLQKGLVSAKFIFGFLRTAIILRASSSCISNLEKRAGMQLHEATLGDLLIPNFSYTMETLYSVDCIRRILDHFLAVDPVSGGASPHTDDGQLSIESSSLAPTIAAKLVDRYLAEIASDVNLKLPIFQSLAAAVPDYARPLDDDLYRAIDIYIKAHPWMEESDREQLCRLMDCRKLSSEACTHAAQNESLPLRTITQILFFEQVRIRSSIGGCVGIDASRHPGTEFEGSSQGGWAAAMRENLVLGVGMDSMRMRVSELEKECSNMRKELERLGLSKGSSRWGGVSKKLGFKVKPQMCSAHGGEVSVHKNGSARNQVAGEHSKEHD